MERRSYAIIAGDFLRAVRCGAANTQDAAHCFACQQQLVLIPAPGPAPAPRQGVAGRYRIVRAIGQGGFGVVYQARDLRRWGRVVAFKQTDLGRLGPRAAIAATNAFHREVRFLSTLSHAHLPEIYDHFTDASHWYLVME